METTRARIAIATCATYEDLKADDRLLQEALAARGVEAPTLVWDRDGVDWRGFDACLVRSTWDYHDRHEQFLAWTRNVGAAIPLWNPPDLIAWNIDKTYLRELGESGVPVVPTVWLRRGEEADLAEVLAERGWVEAVVKPAVDLGAKNLTRVRVDGTDDRKLGEGRAGEAGVGSDLRESQAALEQILSRHDAMVQPFLPSIEAQGELSLIYIAGKFTHAVRKRPAPGDFRVQGIWGGSVTSEHPGETELQLGRSVLGQLPDAPLYARVDLVEDLTGHPSLIELELIEPNLYLQQNPATADALAEAVANRLCL
jgi:hypothetical protein